MSDYDVNLDNSQPRPPVQSRPIVKPCFCCEVEHETHFKFFTLYLIFFSGFDLLVALTLSFISWRFSGLLATIFDIPILILAIIAFVKYNEKKNYGQGLHTCLAMFVLVLFSLFFVLAMFGVLTLIILRSASMLDKLIPADKMPLIWALAGAYFVVYLPFALFNIYWSFLYYP